MDVPFFRRRVKACNVTRSGRNRGHIIMGTHVRATCAEDSPISTIRVRRTRKHRVFRVESPCSGHRDRRHPVWEAAIGLPDVSSYKGGARMMTKTLLVFVLSGGVASVASAGSINISDIGGGI